MGKRRLGKDRAGDELDYGIGGTEWGSIGWERVKMDIFDEKTKKQMCDEIGVFFREEYDLELGMIGTGRILDFFQEILGDRIYNKALDDARKFYAKYADNMETDYYALYKDVK